MARIESLNVLTTEDGKAYLAEEYGKVIENVQKNTISSNMKNKDLSGDPTAGTVEAKRFANASSQDYGTARAAGAGNAVSKAVCAVAEKLYMLDLAEQQAIAAASGSSSITTTDGTASGIITGKSAGSESINYASPSESASGASEWSAIFAAAGDVEATNKILLNTARLYLMGVRADSGIPILYAGF